MVYDPERAGGLPVADGPSGVRPDAPQPAGKVIGSDGGDADRLALLAVDDIQEFWEGHYLPEWPGRFTPVSELVSYDSTDPLAPDLCGQPSYGDPNAHYCPTSDSMSWDRGALIPVGRKFYSDVAIVAVLAHEYGHEIQHRARLVDDDVTRTIVKEQEADCFSGVYIRWVAEGHSRRFTISTTDGLDRVLAGALYIRDAPGDVSDPADGHGSAFDRISAFQKGFEGGPRVCADIDEQEIAQRGRGLPALPAGDGGETPIDDDSLSTLLELLGEIFHPAHPPTLTVGGDGSCQNAKASPPASYCPATNTININLPGLQKVAEVKDEQHDQHILQGDDTAFSMVTSRYALAVEREQGAALDTEQAALRTACLTGVAQKAMARPITLASGKSLVLSAGDLDEAVSGLLSNHLVASDTDGRSVPAGFTRIDAFRSGLIGDADKCYQVFP
ncbi:peptidase [Mycolicibacterium madagascariense]|uniref:Peptidase n=2 Tax=Mycolicibacterium madagascariense TaxID=212765 RepID=A0A7I7XEK2_9MYCO|nr:peptidase [Mycolicibacterium madagascariense]